MTLDTLALIALTLAAVPCGLHLLNLLVYRPLPGLQPESTTPSIPHDLTSGQDQQTLPASPISVLIPARNEQRQIRGTIESVLANRGCEFEVVVLDDHSTDETARIVQEMAGIDPRIRLESSPPLPPGWCGKQHACHVLAGLSRFPILIFLDADVRLAQDALARIRQFMATTEAQLASGIPRQILGSFGERLLLPLIHSVLLGWLPMHLMRWTRMPGFSAGCGQLFVARRPTYFATGGHASIRGTLHDGVKLPRLFRRNGYATALFDATDVASCRMYQNTSETLAGLAKNATEGLAAPGTILPMTLLLATGQVLPIVLLAFVPLLSPGALANAALAAGCLYLPRFIGVHRFRQPLISALLHPVGMMALLAIQWAAFAKYLMGRPAVWKGRQYPGSSSIHHPHPQPRLRAARRPDPATVAKMLLLAALQFVAGPSDAAEPTHAPSCIELRDQYDTPQKLSFPATIITVLTVADKDGAKEVDAWVAALKTRYGSRVDIRGLADVSGAPRFLQDRIRRKFRETRTRPIMMDWSGDIVAALGCQKGMATILIIDRDGLIRARFSGPADPQAIEQAAHAIDDAAAPQRDIPGRPSHRPRPNQRRSQSDATSHPCSGGL